MKKQGRLCICPKRKAGEKLKKQKAEEVNFIDLNKEKKKRKKKAKNQKNKKQQEIQETQELIELDNEILVGVKEIPEEAKKQKSKKQKKKQKVEKKAQQNKKIQHNQKKDEPKKETKISKKRKRISFFIKAILLITIFIGMLFFLLTSPLFNILEIKVENNNKITTEEIINLSEIQLGDNTFKINSRSVINKIKQNPYIEEVKISRDLPSTIHIKVKERKTTYILAINESEYAYINNQGYILEVNSQPLDLPHIINYKTEDFTAGARLCNEDLEKLEVVLRIMETANSHDIGKLITEIDIASKSDFKIRLESEKKTVYLGDASDINTKMLYIKANLEDEKGVEGELFMDGKRNKENEFLFREKV